ncbi:hypothetical protein CYY_001819 [Polysphondylium violaceum]|uniref:Serine aminopeptidase S33 domain-containing protein n=1 Tax=Polysphondylium violaceum TaxID=133409 RepID=A0A8J4Q179_9MYCE|nr:hypothetical protein CYY_001819 [Polysphondylium violaceum]
MIFSLIVLLFSLAISLGFIHFISQALLYFPWWRGLVQQSGDPLGRHGIAFHDIEFTGFDTNHTVRGWWVPALDKATDEAKENRGITMVVVHGSGKDRYEFFEQIKVFHQEGLSVMVYDSIDGTGRSDSMGRGIGYSYREHKDVRAAIRFVKKAYPQHSEKLILTGMSLGGGSVIIAGAKDKDLIDGVIAESPYAHAGLAWKHNIYRYLAEGVTHFFKWIQPPFDSLIPTNPPEWFVDIVIEYTLRNILRNGGPNMSRDDTPINYVAQISPKPILFIHATQDPVVPYTHSEILFKKAQEPKDFWTINYHIHTTGVHSSSVEAYREKLLTFLKQI